MNYIEIKVRMNRTQEDGRIKSSTEKYLVEAESFMDAEAIVTGVLTQRDEDFSIKSETRPNIKEIVFNDASDSRFYKIRIDMLTYDDKTDKKKRAAHNVLVEAVSVETAIDALRKAFKGTLCDYEIMSVAKTAISEVLSKDE